MSVYRHLTLAEQSSELPLPRGGEQGWGSWASRVAASASAFTYTTSAQVYVNPLVGWVLIHR